ncbi:MAG: hypothetical protein WA814_12355 [Candidatus Baltobacteraceae bacterium]
MPKATANPTPPPPANVLPFDSTLVFVLDDPISSKGAKSGDVVRVHLKEAIVVGGHVVAPAQSPGEIKIVDVSHSDIGDTYGFVDIYFEPLQLPDGRKLPLRAPSGRLAPNVSSGHESTVATEDTVGDIFVPYYSLYQIFRKGKNFVLGPGSEIPARTEATITTQTNGTIAIVTPRPLSPGSGPPNPIFPVEPMATPFGPGASSGHSHGHPAAPSPTPASSPSPTPSP